MGETAIRIVLASQSPRRAQLLRMLGLAIETLPADVDETYHAGEEAGAHAERLARAKVEAVAGRRPDAVIIGSDTVVTVDGEVLGKPRDHTDAVRMLMRLQGREHEVTTGIAVWRDELWSGVERVAVTFRPFDEQTAHRYADTEEPMDKAGAYGIQGYGSTLVERITGDYYAVVGLPIARMIELLAKAGLRYNFRGLETAPPS
ncbi:Maf family protein [soil metagenome]